MGPNPMEKKATYAQIAKIARIATNPGFCCTPAVTGRSLELGFGTCRKTKPMASVKRETVIPIALVKTIGRRPIRSSQMLATKMNRVFENPTATVAPRTPDFPEIPAWLNTEGL